MDTQYYSIKQALSCLAFSSFVFLTLLIGDKCMCDEQMETLLLQVVFCCFFVCVCVCVFTEVCLCKFVCIFIILYDITFIIVPINNYLKLMNWWEILP